MVIKGGARGGAGDLAAHLSRTDHNERMEVRELRGVAALDLEGALREMAASAAASRSRREFYSSSINTGPGEAMTPEQQAYAIDRLEREQGLTGQPRAVVEHTKDGRAHVHVVWLRIDLETMTGISDSHNYRRHEIVARELEREFGHRRVQGAHIEREGVERPPRALTLDQVRQAERCGISPEDAKARLRELWEAADNGRSFAAALDDAGWTLARGDKRGFVALDPTGEVRSVNKDVTGLTAAKVRDRLVDIDLEQLPSVEEAREGQRERQRERDQAAALQRQAKPTPEPVQAPEPQRQPEPVRELRLEPVPALDPAKPVELASELRQEAAREPEEVLAMVVAPPEPKATQQPEKGPSWLRRVWDGLFGRQRQAEPVAASPEPKPEPMREAPRPEPERVREKTPTELNLERQRGKPEPEDLLELVKRRIAEREAKEAERLAAMTPEQRADHDRQEAERKAKEQERYRGRSLEMEMRPTWERGRRGPGF